MGPHSLARQIRLRCGHDECLRRSGIESVAVFGEGGRLPAPCSLLPGKGRVPESHGRNLQNITLQDAPRVFTAENAEGAENKLG